MENINLNAPPLPNTPSPISLPPLPQSLIVPPLPQSPVVGPLSEEQYAQVRQAALARRVIRSAWRTAKSSGTVTLVIGLLALLYTALDFSVVGFAVSVCVGVIGVIELYGAGRMQRAEASAARMLGWNQVALLCVIVIYCVVQAATFSSEKARDTLLSPEFCQQLSALPEMNGSINKMTNTWAPMLVYGFYGLVALVSAGVQGGMAAYYFTRRKRVVAFNAQTPAWLRRLIFELDGA